jgi:hypothetical protein
VLILGLALVAAGALTLGSVPISGLEVDPAEVRLRGSDDRAQVVVTGRGPGADVVDLTHEGSVIYEAEDPGIARVEPGGRVRPTGDGATRVAVRAAGRSATVRVVVEDFEGRRPVAFAGEVVPIFTRAGCNAGTCHGRAGGQNGFRLGLRGFDPRLDYESLTREGRGRRVFPSAPGSSLVLRKPTAQVPHGGGRRFDVGSPEYRTIARWIAQGMPFEPEREPTVERIVVSPGRRRLARGSGQQLRVTADRTDGTSADVTHQAQYQSNAPDLAVVDERGRVEARDGAGEAAIVARFVGRVAVARITVSLGDGAPAGEPPASRNFVDRLVFDGLRALGVPPSGPCTDAEFARRSALDICGILPDPDDVDALERDTDPEKRTRWVDRLLGRPEYADLFAMKWSALLRNKRSLGALSKPGTFAFHAWIRQALAENRPYDRLVAEVLTARGDPAVNPPIVWFRQFTTAEELADDVAQLFLGVRIQCARCHHHPFESWGQDDYYSFASFFSRVGRKPSDDPVTPRVFVLPEGLASDPVTGKTYPPRWPGGPTLTGLGPRDDPRRALADWLARPENPYFARALVNRYWKHFFGRGLVEPEDDLRPGNPPAFPELLDALADDFVCHGFDLRHLVRTIATSRAYDRSNLANAWNGHDRQGLARHALRRLPAEVLVDAIGTATGRSEAFDGLPPSFHAVQLPDEGFSSYILDIFGRPRRASACECERSAESNLSQRLFLLNSVEIQRQLGAEGGRAARWAADDRTPDPAKVDALYRICLARRPTDEERAACLDHLARARGRGRLREGFEDLLWALINSKEFLTE